jgi:hypothetical protein
MPLLESITGFLVVLDCRWRLWFYCVKYNDDDDKYERLIWWSSLSPIARIKSRIVKDKIVRPIERPLLLDIIILTSKIVRHALSEYMTITMGGWTSRITGFLVVLDCRWRLWFHCVKYNDNNDQYEWLIWWLSLSPIARIKSRIVKDKIVRHREESC